jgi:hypothetical protein
MMRELRGLLLVVLGLALAPAARAQEYSRLPAPQLREVRAAQPLVGAYEGTLGSRYPIRLHLSTADSALTGQYYYQRNGRRLDLLGRVNPETGLITLTEKPENDTAATGRFVARPLPDQSLTGTWYNAAGTVLLPFRLTRVAGTAPPAADHARVQDKTYLHNFTVPVVTVPDAGVTAVLKQYFSLETLAGETLASLREQAEAQRTEGYAGLQQLSYSVTCNRRGLLSLKVTREGIGSSVWYDGHTYNLDLNTGFAVDVADEIRPEQLARFLALGQRKLRPVLEDIVQGQRELLNEEDRVGLLAEQFSLGSVQEYTMHSTGLTFDHTAQYSMGNFLFRTLQGSFTVEFSWAELAPFLKPDSPLRRLLPAGNGR